VPNVTRVTTVLAEPGSEDAVLPLFPEHDPFNDPDYAPPSTPPPLRGRIRYRLDDVARARGLVITSGRYKGQVNLSAITRGTGLAYATVYKILRQEQDTTGMSKQVMARLCEFLHCTPGDLMVYEPMADEPDTRLSDTFWRRERKAAKEHDLTLRGSDYSNGGHYD
jgi:DNA-binding Xre family transcriptional regulator